MSKEDQAGVLITNVLRVQYNPDNKSYLLEFASPDVPHLVLSRSDVVHSVNNEKLRQVMSDVATRAATEAIKDLKEKGPAPVRVEYDRYMVVQEVKTWRGKFKERIMIEKVKGSQIEWTDLLDRESATALKYRKPRQSVVTVGIYKL